MKYSFIHNFRISRLHPRALSFSLFFIASALYWLILASLTSAAAKRGVYDFYAASVIVPEMIRSAAFSVPLAVISGLIIDSVERSPRAHE